MRAFTLALPLIVACASPGDPSLRVPAERSVGPAPEFRVRINPAAP